MKSHNHDKGGGKGVRRKGEATYLPAFESTDHCRLIYDLPSGGIDQDSPRLECLEHSLTHDPFCLLAQGYVYTKDVRLCIHLIDAVRGEVLSVLGSEWVRTSAVVQYAHAEGPHEFYEAEGDSPKAKDSKRLRGGVMSGFESGLPVPGPEALFRAGELSEGRDEKVESGGGRCIVDGARCIGDHDACESSVL